MKQTMRLFTRNGWFHIEFYRGKSKSLKTKDPKEAEKLYRDIEREAIRGRLINLEKVKRCTISEFKELYLNTRTGLASGTTVKDEYCLKVLQDALGDIQIRTVSGAKIEEFKRISWARKLKPETINGYLRHLKAAFSYALDEGYIEKKPKFKMCRVEEKLPRVNPPEALNKILNRAKELDIDLWRFFTFLLWTGCRRAEALGLKWQDCFFENQEGKGKKTKLSGECKVKGKGGKERMVPLIGPVIDALYPIKKDIGRVFPEWHKDTVTHKFIEIAKECSIKIRLHDLRHNAVTYMLKSGVPIQVVQKIVGHAQLSTTMIYTHIIDEIKRQEMSKFQIK